QATDAGVELLCRTRFLRYRLTGQTCGGSGAGGVVVSVLREGVETELRARLLVGADGAFSRVAGQVRGSAPVRMVAGIGADADYAGPPLDHVEVFVDHWAAPGWFGWTIPLGAGSARVGTGSASGIKPIESFDRLRERFPDTFGRTQVRSYRGGPIAIWEPTPLAADRVLLVGDAARQVKPTSGGGIHAALHAAGLAAAAASSAITLGDCSRRGLEPYARAWHASLGGEMRRGHDLRRIYTQLDHSRLDAIGRVLARDGVRGEVDAVGDIDLPSRMAWALVRRAPVLAVRLATLPRFPRAWLSARGAGWGDEPAGAEGSR
ncbi:MAG: NAD(P)/FAD-dependent oxidoreductase, partial [Actinobacteria bacterium]|nr:NAD(P)/FAD-dependent oxidoreductase [Actinomycetota bacterium]